MPKNLSWLTGLRALACLSVIAYHLNQQRSIENLPQWSWDLYQFIETWPVTVSFFFILWGLLRSAPYWRTVYEWAPAPDAKRALIDRFLRIAPAYYVALACTLVAVYAILGWMDDAFLRILWWVTFLSWTHPSTFFPSEINGPLWYIAFDMLGWLTVIAVMGAVVKLPRKFAWAWIAGAAWLLLAGHYAFTSIPFPQGDGPVAVWFPTYNPFLFWLHFLLWMAFGWAAIYAEMKNMKHSHWFDAAFVVSMVAAFSFLWTIREADDFAYSWPTGPYRFPLVPILLWIGLFTVAYTKNIGRLLDNRPFKWIAKLSYSAYLYHALVIGTLRHTVFPGHAVETPDWLALVAITVPTTFVLAHFSHEYVEMRMVVWYRNRKSKTA